MGPCIPETVLTLAVKNQATKYWGSNVPEILPSGFEPEHTDLVRYLNYPSSISGISFLSENFTLDGMPKNGHQSRELSHL